MGEKVLIFGATSAIAQATARLFASEGASFFLVARNDARLAEERSDLISRGAGAIDFLARDLADIEGNDDLIEEIWRSFGPPDVVLVAHGLLGDQSESENDYSNTEAVFRTNFLSPVSLLTPLANRMQAEGKGTIAVISSVAGDRGRASNYVYGSSKAGLDTWLSGLRNRLAKHNVHVLTIRPGFVDTPMTAGMEKNPLFTDPATAGQQIHNAIRKKRDVAYVPGYWRAIMSVIRHIPEPVFKRLKL